MADTTHDPVLTFAQVELGGLRFGLATSHVVQALARPRSLTRLPRSHGALEGVFNNRGQVVPVVDLRKWMADAPATDGTPPHVMVLAAEGRVVGVAVDAIRSLLRVRASCIHRVHRDDSSDSFFHSVAMPDDGGEPVSLLDPVRLMAQTQAWANGSALGDTGEAVEGVTHTTHGSTATATPPQALLRLGNTLLAVPALHVGEVVPALPVQRIFGRDNPLLGMVRWRQYDLPLVNPDRTLGLPPAPKPATPRLMAVLLVGERGLALPVDEVVGLRGFAHTRVQAAADSGLEHASLFAGTTQLDGGERVHLLDTDRLLALCHLGNQGTPPAGPATAAPQAALPALGSDAPQREGHIVFDAGALWAAPLSALLEITHLPANFRAQPPNTRGVIGTLEWRGRALPVLDVRQPTAERGPEHPTGAKLIAVQAHGAVAGLVVNDVVALLPAHVGVHTRLLMAGGEWLHMITVGDMGQRKSYRVMAVGNLPFFATGAAQ